MWEIQEHRGGFPRREHQEVRGLQDPELLSAAFLQTKAGDPVDPQLPLILYIIIPTMISSGFLCTLTVIIIVLNVSKVMLSFDPNENRAILYQVAVAQIVVGVVMVVCGGLYLWDLYRG